MSEVVVLRARVLELEERLRVATNRQPQPDPDAMGVGGYTALGAVLLGLDASIAELDRRRAMVAQLLDAFHPGTGILPE